MKVLLAVFCVLTVAMMVTAAGASDFNFGSYARSVAMGGAGLAMTDDAAASSIINPAAAAAVGAKFQFVFPSLDYHTRGATISDLSNRTNELSSGNDSDALALAEDFGKTPTTLNVGFATGFAGRFGMTAEGEAQGIISPGANFTQWVLAGLPRNATDLQAAVTNGTISNTAFTAAINIALADGTINGTDATDIADAFVSGTNVAAKFIYALPAVNYSRGVNTAGGKLWLGTRMRWLNSEAHTWTMTQKAGVTDRVELQATEDLTQKSEDSGFGADLGFIYQPEKSLIQYGMVVNNFWDAQLAGIDTPLMVSAGIAAQPNKLWSFAADLVNINKAYNEGTQLRMGAELNLTRKLALRAGYSGNSFTYGFGLFGMNFAFSGDAPNLISRALRF
ncbi:MAG: hypothetical protein ACYC64_05870 [Armatimonadota bacterium]